MISIVECNMMKQKKKRGLASKTSIRKTIPSGLRLLAEHVARAAPPVEESWDSEGEEKEAEAVEAETDGAEEHAE